MAVGVRVIRLVTKTTLHHTEYDVSPTIFTMSCYVVIVHREPSTFIYGVYSSLEEAAMKTTDMILNQVNYKKLKTFFDKLWKSEGHGHIQLSKEVLQSYFSETLKSRYSNSDSDIIESALGDDINITIFNEPTGKLFDFTGYGSWAEKNLFMALQAILKGKFGTLKNLPYAPGRLIFE